MSDNLYLTRLRWDGRRGIAKLDGVQLPLINAPVLSGVQFEAIDYIPEIHCFLIRQLAYGERDMTPEECRSAERYLNEAFRDA